MEHGSLASLAHSPAPTGGEYRDTAYLADTEETCRKLTVLTAKLVGYHLSQPKGLCGLES